jgi:hypothetical protein
MLSLISKLRSLNHAMSDGIPITLGDEYTNTTPLRSFHVAIDWKLNDIQSKSDNPFDMNPFCCNYFYGDIKTIFHTLLTYGNCEFELPPISGLAYSWLVKLQIPWENSSNVPNETYVVIEELMWDHILFINSAKAMDTIAALLYNEYERLCDIPPNCIRLKLPDRIHWQQMSIVRDIFTEYRLCTYYSPCIQRYESNVSYWKKEHGFGGMPSIHDRPYPKFIFEYVESLPRDQQLKAIDSIKLGEPKCNCKADTEKYGLELERLG